MIWFDAQNISSGPVPQMPSYLLFEHLKSKLLQYSLVIAELMSYKTFTVDIPQIVCEFKVSSTLLDMDEEYFVY